jgi:hypothetical protein
MRFTADVGLRLYANSHRCRTYQEFFDLRRARRIESKVPGLDLIRGSWCEDQTVSGAFRRRVDDCVNPAVGGGDGGRWKMAPVYCQAVLCYDQRIALDGSPAETVDADAKDLATKQLR